MKVRTSLPVHPPLKGITKWLLYLECRHTTVMVLKRGSPRPLEADCQVCDGEKSDESSQEGER